jgi:putative phosphonate catabolism associated alcohol dehydrogenase
MKTGNIVAFEGHEQPLVIMEKQVREIGPDEILVKNLYTTICGSDLHTYCGIRKEKCPTVLGHEITGSIEEIGSRHPGKDGAGLPLNIGDKITWSVFSSDPNSKHSLEGMPQKGDDLFKYGHAQIAGEDIFHGGLAEYCILKKGTAVFKIPDELPLEIAATINCAIATVAGALRLSGDVKDKTVLITGMGLLGITCAAMCREAGAAHVIAADISHERLNTALTFGAHQKLNLKTNDALSIQADIDMAFDMSGSPDAMEFGLQHLGIGGIAVWVGAVFNTREIQVDAERIIRNLISIKGLHNYNFEDLKNAVAFIGKHWKDYPFMDVVSKDFPLEQATEAFEYALKHKPLRVGIRL